MLPDEPGTGPAPALLAQLAAVRGDGTAAGDLIRASVDGTGELTELEIDPRAMRLASGDLAREIRSAVAAARQDAAARLGQERSGAVPPAGPDIAALQRLLADVDSAARQRLDQFARFADDLSARLGSS